MATKKHSKRIPKAQAEALARHVKAYIDREYGGVQRAAERGMGISQSHLSALMRPEDRRGPGLSVLLQLRSKLRMSLDSLLDLPPLEGVSQEEIDAKVKLAILKIVKQPDENDPRQDEAPSRPKGV